MRYWVREIAGWLLMGLGLYVFYGVYEMVLGGHYFECAPWLLMGIIIFRGGMHLVRVALAARICSEVQLPQTDRMRGPGAAARRHVPVRNAPLGQT